MSPIIIALDGMGGDFAPHAVVEGAAYAQKKHPDLRFRLYGQADKLQPILAQHAELAKVVELIDCPDIISNDDKPAKAIRSGRQSSMAQAIEAVKQDEAHAVVSSGNTGVLMALALFALRTLPGIDRPAICTSFPTIRGSSCMLDLGANVECTSDQLVEFAILGEIYARVALAVKKPSLGLLNIGVEQIKGSETLKLAAKKLEYLANRPGVNLEYKGFVEGDDIGKGTVDVVVTDGFTGNIALKTIEGTAKLLSHNLKQSFARDYLSKLGYLFALRSLNQFRHNMDPRRYNGAMLLGLNGIVVKSHGSSDKVGFSTAIEAAYQMVKSDVLTLIRHEIELYHSQLDDEKLHENNAESILALGI